MIRKGQGKNQKKMAVPSIEPEGFKQPKSVTISATAFQPDSQAHLCHVGMKELADPDENG